MHILSRMEANTIYCLQFVSKTWSTYCRKETLWDTLFLRDFPQAHKRETDTSLQAYLFYRLIRDASELLSYSDQIASQNEGMEMAWGSAFNECIIDTIVKTYHACQIQTPLFHSLVPLNPSFAISKLNISVLDSCRLWLYKIYAKIGVSINTDRCVYQCLELISHMYHGETLAGVVLFDSIMTYNNKVITTPPENIIVAWKSLPATGKQQWKNLSIRYDQWHTLSSNDKSKLIADVERMYVSYLAVCQNS